MYVVFDTFRKNRENTKDFPVFPVFPGLHMVFHTFFRQFLGHLSLSFFSESGVYVISLCPMLKYLNVCSGTTERILHLAIT